MPVGEQCASARAQLEAVDRDALLDAKWVIHQRDLTELRTLIGDAHSLYGVWFMVLADPDLEGRGPGLVWDGLY